MSILLVTVLAGAALRVYRLGESPPGMNIDEAAAIWNAYSLLKTGMDQHGVRWPIFHAKVLGDDDQRSTLFIYYLVPFLAAGGMSDTIAQVAGAVAGVAGILLLYYCGSRLFGRGTGLVGAAILVANPWDLRLTRSGHEGLMMPLLLLVPFATMLWANFPFGESDGRIPRPLHAVIAGSLAGISCYGYPANRIVLPLFFAVAVLLSWRDWWQKLHDRRWTIAAGLMLFSAAVFFLPLIWMHLTDSAMAGRAQVTWVWAPDDSLGQKIMKVAGRYPMHFGLPFLFQSGERYPPLAPPKGYGEFLWFTLPLMIAGVVCVVKQYRSSTSVRTLAALVLLYPAGDLLTGHTLPTSPHAFRGATGIVAMALLAAYGAVCAWNWLWRRGRLVAMSAGCLFLFVVLGMSVEFLQDFFGSYNREADIYRSHGVDLIRGLDWLKPRLATVDVVFCTTDYVPHPYMYSLVHLGYDPKQWFNNKPEVTQIPTRDRTLPYEDVTHFGKMYFFYGGSVNATIQSLYRNGRTDHVVFIVRPHEFTGNTTKPSLEIRDTQGKVSLLIYEMDM